MNANQRKPLPLRKAGKQEKKKTKMQRCKDETAKEKEMTDD
jgi:hypothetical protein